MSRSRLVGRLGASARVTVASALPGSGKTVLLRSWVSQAGAPSCAVWVPVGRAEHDPQRFWLSVLAALRQTDLAPLNNRVWLVLGRETGDDDLRGAW